MTMADKVSYVSCYDGTMVRVGQSFVTVPRGAAVPPGTDEGHLAVLIERGMVAEGEPVSGFVLDDDAQPPFEPPTEEKSGRRSAAKES